jgi:hypothetical protein
MKAGDEILVNGQWLFVISAEDYEELLMAAEADGDLDWCETCGTWLTLDDPARASIEDYRGCWKTAAAESDDSLCRSYRVSERVKAIRERREMQRRLDGERKRNPPSETVFSGEVDKLWP